MKRRHYRGIAASFLPVGMTKRASEYHFVTSCIGSTYEAISALKQSERAIGLRTFREAIGVTQWRELLETFGYDRYLPISKDWHVGYYKGVYLGRAAVFLRHSGIEYIFTKD